MYKAKSLKWLLLIFYFHCVFVHAEILITNDDIIDDTPDELNTFQKEFNVDSGTRTKRRSYTNAYEYNDRNYESFIPVQHGRGSNIYDGGTSYGGPSYSGAYQNIGKGPEHTPSAYMNSWLKKSQYNVPPGIGIKSPPKRAPITSILIPYSGCPVLPLPLNMSYQCKALQCVLQCSPHYSFADGETILKASCDKGKWNIQGQNDANLPNCQPICKPPCQNNGICWEPGRCKCAENFSGILCETKSDSVCSTRLPMIKNANVQCKNDICNAVCMGRFQFPDGSKIANVVCQEGQWIHKATGSAELPDCQPTCNPSCMNNGQCISYNMCQCDPKFRGEYCQYGIDRCNITTNGFNGNFKCSYDQNEAICTLTCPQVEGLTIEGKIDLPYTCKYDVGEFSPKPIPKCILPPNYSIYQSSSSEYYSEKKKPIRFASSISRSQKVYNIREKLLELIAEYRNIKQNGEWLSYQNSLVSPGYYKLYKTETVNVVVDRTPRRSACASWSGKNVKTFDGLVYKTQLSCSHTLVTDTSDLTFDITLKTCPFGSTYDCPHHFDIYWQSVVYTLKNTNGTVNLETKTKTLSIPVQVFGMKVVASAQNIHMTLEAIGLEIIWDRQQYVVIYAGPTLWKKVGGLCGSLDGDVDNDMVSRKGVSLQTVKSFIDSWKVGDFCSVQYEREVDFSLQSCQLKDQDKALDTCRRLLTNSKFKDCLNNFNYQSLLQSCLEDYCHCEDQEQPEKCNCASMAMLAEECSFRGIELNQGWRDLEICPLTCSNGRIYMSCGPELEATCDSAVLPKIGKCIEGCFCPRGTVQHEDSCITPELCPCFMKGRQFKPESIVKKNCNTCVCKNAKWDCTDEDCTARCGAIGDPHYQTFDGKRYNFMGKCSYYLLKTDEITVETENIACSGAISENFNFEVTADDPSCTKSLAIKFNTNNGEPTIVKLDQGLLVLVNDKVVSKFPKVLGRGEVLLRQASSEFVTVEFPKGLKIYWDGKSRAYIDAPPSLRNKTSGLCGTFNSNTEDDFLTPEGDIETAVEPFADKWRTKDICDFPAKTQDGPHPCSVDPSRNELAEKHCAWILDDIFQDCHWTVEAERYYEDCLYDVCACKEELTKCFCPILSAYGDECLRQGIKTGWRSHVKDCATKCAVGQVYDECGNSCTRSCEDIPLTGTCAVECIEGCRCPHGTYINNNNECVPQNMCHCLFDGNLFKPGYKEVRQGSKFLDICICANATWQCEPATAEDEHNYPPAAELRSKCAKSAYAEFSLCAPLEPKTCKNMDIYKPDLNDCKPGCVCMPDYVLDTATKECVLANNCSCHHAGKSYSDGQQIKDKCNLCMCQSGQWECSKEVCDSTCSVWGDSHFSTFDNHDFDFQGACDYILSKGINEYGQGYTIIVQNVLCGSMGVTCSKSLEIAISGNITDSILLNAGHTRYNDSILSNSREQINGKTHGAFYIFKSGVFITVEVVHLGLQVRWDEGTRAYVKLSKEWKGKVSGLCGNYNDNSMDDMKTPTQSLEISPLIFGHSWKVQNFCSQPSQPIDACKEHPERETWAQLKCGILKSETFESCHYDVPVEPFLKRCMFDTCSCDQGGDCECLCTAVAAYAHACSQKDISIRWRSSHFCPMQCDAHCSTYDACTPACGIETCENFFEEEKVESMCNKEPCIEGCKVLPCEPGMIYKNDSYLDCIPKSQCKPVCLIVNGTTYYEGDVMFQDECSTCHCSKKKKICSGIKCSVLVPAHKSIEMFTTETPLNADIEPQCVQGWTRWYDNDATDSNEEMQLNDEEFLPAYDRFESIYGTCSALYMNKIECRVVKNNNSAEFMDENVNCSLEKGLTCLGKCHDYEIRVYCQCFADELVSVTNTEKPSIGVLCDNIMAEYKELPGDCHKFLHCQPKSVNGDWHYVEKTCGESMMFNPTINVCDHISTVQQIKPNCGKNEKEVDVSKICPEGMVLSNCANQCENACHYYKQILLKRGLCQEREHCKQGCIPGMSQDCHALGKYWLNEKLCVDMDECPCMAENEKYIQPHIPVAYEDTLCQCLSSEFICTGNTAKKNETENLYVLPSQNLTIFPTTQSPPLACDSTKQVKMVDGEIPLSDAVFSASSELSEKHSPKYARLSSTANSWSPKINDQMQYLQITFDNPVPLYGVISSGNPELNNYVTLFKILYSYDDEAYHYLVDTTDGPQLFNGPIESRLSLTSLFKIPIEAKSVRIYPLKWHGRIALRVDLLGCQHKVDPVEQYKQELLETLSVGECVDHMGIENEKLNAKQIRVSSSILPDVKITDQLKLSSNLGWKPFINTKNEFVIIDFLEPQNISGIITKGGQDGWVTGYIVLFSKNKLFWNKILTSSGQARIFTANHDSNTEQTHIFKKPILTQYFKIVPTNWEHNINMRLEVLGCYNPKLKFIDEEKPVKNQQESSCAFCKNIDILTSADCNCTNGLYYDGVECVQKSYCPCVENHISYAVGTKFENKQCEECVCLLGGYSSCKPKKCDAHCSGLNTRPVISSNCLCQCEQCPKGQKICPSSGDCIPQMLWCNGIHDCADDEDDTCHDKIEMNPNIEKNGTAVISSCPEPSCPPNTKLKLIEKKSREMSTMFSSTTTKQILTTNEGKQIKKTKILTTSAEYISMENEGMDMLEEKLCDEFACIPILNNTLACPLPKCPENYDIEVDMSNRKPGDCKYFCVLKPQKDDVCEISGSSITTFDGTEFKYNLCSHTLARDITNTKWMVNIQVHCQNEKRRECRKTIIIEDIIASANLIIKPNMRLNFKGFDYTVEQLIMSPVCKASFIISNPGNSILVVSQRHGVWVLYDNIGYVKIGMSSKYIKTVDGLCGYYNGKANDDKRSPNGTIMTSTIEFGASWYDKKVQPDQCQRYTCPLDLQKKSLSICNSIKHPSFTKCGKYVNYKQYVSKCIENVCECLQANNAKVNSCKCNILQDFVKKCLEVNPNVQLDTWRTEHQCEASCPTPLVHSDCYKRRCELTCNAFKSDDCPIISDACFTGCYCPEGTVRKGNTCVSVNECKDCACNSYGPANYFTYDFNNFTLKGNCTYLLSRDIILPGVNTFEIHVTVADCWSLGYTQHAKETTSCAKAYHILHGDHIVHITHSQNNTNGLLVNVNGMELTKLPYKDSWLNLRLYHNGDLLLLLPNAYIQLSVNFKIPHFSLEVPSVKYGGKLEGLCGHCRKETTTLTPTETETWLSNEPRLNVHSKSCQKTPNIEIIKPNCTEFLPGEKDLCLKLYDQQIFGKCHIIVDPVKYVEICQQNTCKYGRKVNNTCNAITAYNLECQRNGICVDWRNAELCPYNCPTSNMIYSPCACEKTCETVLAMNEFDAVIMNTSTIVKTVDESDMCETFKQTEGCFCPPGKVLDNGICIAEEMCIKCDDGVHVPGENWTKDKCTTCKCNKMGKIDCLSQQCLVEENICAVGFQPKKIDNGLDCCATYICVPEPKLPAAKLCLAALMPVCGPGQFKQQTIGSDGCPSYICVCKPKEECDELEAPRNLKPGEKLVIEEQGCCPTHKIACNKSECPNDIMQCNEPYYEAIMQDETNSCCPSYICQLPKDKCIVNYEEQTPLAKNVFEKWTHPTEPCKHEACIFGANGTAQIKSTIEVCDTQCAEGFTYLPGNSSTCCGKCEQSACLFETKIYKKHEVWHSLDNCTHYKCDISSNNLLIVTTSKETCPDIANCAPNQIVNNGGCCKYCIALPEKIENKSHCLSTVLASNATVELISINKDGHGICANKEAIKDFSVCQGTCTSGTKYNKDTLTFEKMCDCCSITSYKKLSVPLICKTGLTFNYEIEVPNSCGCQPCIESVDNNINPQFDVRMDSEILSMNTNN